ARARGILAQFPTAQHLAHANPRAIRRAAEDAGARGFSLNDATVVRDSARRSLYSGKAAAARAHVVRTLVSQLERLTSAIDEVDRAATALLPPSEPGTGPSDAELLQTIPGIGPQTAATLLGELGAFTRFTDARALVAYVGFYRLSTRAATARRLPACRPSAPVLRAILSTSPPSMPCAVVASGAPFISVRRPRAKQPRKRWSWSPSSCFMRCTPCSSTGSPTTPHVSSSPRRRLGLDISWDVSVEDGWRESSRTPRRAPDVMSYMRTT